MKIDFQKLDKKQIGKYLKYSAWCGLGLTLGIVGYRYFVRNKDKYIQNTPSTANIGNTSRTNDIQNLLMNYIFPLS